MNEGQELLGELENILKEQQMLLNGRLTEEIALQYKQRERRIREIAHRLIDGHQQGSLGSPTAPD